MHWGATFFVATEVEGDNYADRVGNNVILLLRLLLKVHASDGCMRRTNGFGREVLILMPVS